MGFEINNNNEFVENIEGSIKIDGMLSTEEKKELQEASLCECGEVRDTTNGKLAAFIERDLGAEYGENITLKDLRAMFQVRDKINITTDTSIQDGLDAKGIDLSVQKLHKKLEISLMKQLIRSEDSNLSDQEYSDMLENISYYISQKIEEIPQNIYEILEKYDDIEPNETRWMINGRISKIFNELKTVITPGAKTILDANTPDFYENLRETARQDLQNFNRGKEPSEAELEARFQIYKSRVKGNIQKNKNILVYGDLEKISALSISDSPAVEEIFNESHAEIHENFEDVSMLSEADEKIEKEAMLFFMGGIAGLITLELGPTALASAFPGIGTGVGAAIGNGLTAGIEFQDMRSKHETILEIGKQFGMVHPEFHMEKTLIDNILAGIGLIPGATLGIKSLKMGELMSKYGFSSSDVAESMKRVLPVLSIGRLKGNKGRKYQKIFDKNFRKLGSTHDIFESYIDKILAPGSTMTIASGEVKTIKKVFKDKFGNFRIEETSGETLIISKDYFESTNLSFSNKGSLDEYRAMLMIFDQRVGNTFRIKGGNLDRNMQALIDEVRIDGDRLPIMGKGRLSRAEKREKIKIIRETLREQYQILGDMSRQVQEYTAMNKNVSFIELYELFIKPQSENLSPQQFTDATKSLSDFIKKRDAVRKHFPNISKNPQEGVEKIFGLEKGKIQGKIQVEQEDGIIYFFVENPEDYALMYGSDSALESGGFATSTSRIPELQGTIIVKKGLKGNSDWDETVKTHEIRHQRNKLLFTEYREDNYIAGRDNSFLLKDDKIKFVGSVDVHNGVSYAKDEIIAYLKDGSSLKRIEDVLTQEDGLYNYYEGMKPSADLFESLSEADIQKMMSEYKQTWETHVSRVQGLISILQKHITTPEGELDYNKLDLELLSVAPSRHWRFLLGN